MGDAGVKPDAQAPLRLLEGAFRRHVFEHCAQRALAHRDDKQIKPVDQRLDIAFFDPAILDFAATVGEIVHQRRQVKPVIDRAGWLLEVPVEMQGRLRQVQPVVMIVIVLIGIRPVVSLQARFPAPASCGDAQPC